METEKHKNAAKRRDKDRKEGIQKAAQFMDFEER